MRVWVYTRIRFRSIVSGDYWSYADEDTVSNEWDGLWSTKGVYVFGGSDQRAWHLQVHANLQHDTNIIAFLSTLLNVTSLLGTRAAQYSSAVVVELWTINNTTPNQFGIQVFWDTKQQYIFLIFRQVLYRDGAKAQQLEPITSLIFGCNSLQSVNTTCCDDNRTTTTTIGRQVDAQQRQQTANTTISQTFCDFDTFVRRSAPYTPGTNWQAECDSPMAI
jgi:hypothetical protein